MENILLSRRDPSVYVRPQAASDRLNVERVLAFGRLLLSAACLVPVWTGALLPFPYGHLARTLILGYAGFSVFILLTVSFAAALPSWFGIVAHLADFGWAVALTLFTDGPSSPLFVLFLFVLLSAALRWRLVETLLTGLGAMAALAAHNLLAPDFVSQTVGTGRLTAELLLLRSTYMGVAAVLLGLLAENEKGRREQLAVNAELLAGIQAQHGFRLALKYVASVMMRLTRSQVLIVAARDRGTHRSIRWTITRAQDGSTLLTSSDLSNEQDHLYFFRAEGDGWSLLRGRRGCAVIAIDRDEHVVRGERCEVDAGFWDLHPQRAALVIPIGFGRAWRGRVCLLRNRRYSLAELRFVHRALCQVLPAMHNQYLVRRLRSRASAAERRRVARELHDGVMQSLVGLEMETAALRGSAGGRDPDVDRHLQRIQRVLGEEARAVRDVMQQIRPFESEPGQFVPALREIVERFGRDTGITAHFYAASQEVYVPPRAARELARTLQEALTNVRRHSGAGLVEVEFHVTAEAWHLDIENDGRPFSFRGRLSLDELEARRIGPRVIKERVRDMGGDLVIESSDTSGARLEISLPRPEGQSKSA